MMWISLGPMRIPMVSPGVQARVEWMSHSRPSTSTVSYTHLRAHETDSYLVCRLLLEKKKDVYYTHLRAHETGRNLGNRRLTETKNRHKHKKN